MSLLLALQFWGNAETGDWRRAMELASFLADLHEYDQPTRSDTRFTFCSRFDTQPKRSVVEKVSDVFRTDVIQSKREASGWPYGPNELWSESVCQIHARWRAGKLPGVEAVLTFEPDCVPLSRDWVLRLLSEWRARKPGSVMGAWGKFTMPGQPPELGHLNGNMLVRPDLPEVVPSCIGSPPRIPWDVYHAKRFERAGWAPTPLISNAYQKPEISESEWDEYASAGAVFLHGVKGKSALEISARRLLVTA